MEELIKYLRPYLKCNWVLRENSLTLGNCLVSYNFIEKVKQYNAIEFIYSKENCTSIIFNTDGLNDKSDILAFSGDIMEGINIKITTGIEKNNYFVKPFLYNDKTITVDC